MERRRLPLNALRAFEAAARHESLTRAASELSVTHAAVSRHVRALEQQLRVALFERTGRGVVLTEAGRLLAKDLSDTFDHLERATGRFVRSARRRQRLTITTDVPFAAHWLVPRLGQFTRLHPEIELVLDPNQRPVDFAKEDADIGIRYGGGHWRGIESEKLFDADLTVVCHPAVLKSSGVEHPRDLPPKAMIQELDGAFWRTWLKAANAGSRVVPAGPTLLADMTVSAAEAGHGFALSDRLLAADALLAGRLVAPFAVSVRCGGYYLVRRARTPLSKSADAFRRWLAAALQRSVADLAELEKGGRYGAAAVSGTKRTRKPPIT